MNKQELIDFENEIASLYEDGKILGPIHLRSGNEDHLISIFEDINDEDYVFATWANHLEALLKGIPKEEIKKRILDCESMAMNFPEYKFYTSAIVGGICSIAVGVANAIKLQGKQNKVYCFLGDMGFMTGIASESIRYAHHFDLPIVWIVADNNKSVCTDTTKTWGKSAEETYNDYIKCGYKNIRYYKYTSTWPHSGTGTFISF